MQIQSLVIDAGQIELSLGSNDGGREYVFARLPFNGDDHSDQSLRQLRLASLNQSATLSMKLLFNCSQAPADTLNRRSLNRLSTPPSGVVNS